MSAAPCIFSFSVNLGQIAEGVYGMFVLHQPGCRGPTQQQTVSEVGAPAWLLLWTCWTYRKSRNKQKAITDAVVQQSRKWKPPSLWITCGKRRRQRRRQRLSRAADLS